MNKRIWAISIWVVLMAVCLCPGAWAEVQNPTLNMDQGSIVLTKDNNGKLRYKQGSGGETEYSGEMTLQGETTANTISVASGTHNITLSGVKIDVGGVQDSCAFLIKVGAKANVTLAAGTENILKSGSSCAGLQVPGEPSGKATLTLKGEGKLYAQGDRGAGIGGGFGYESVLTGVVTSGSGGVINIYGGKITAVGTGGGAGIGAGEGSVSHSTYGEINIDGGEIVARTQDGGAGIGGSRIIYGGEINIRGGKITASGSGYYNSQVKRGSAGIGGDSGNPGGKITISGGTIRATRGLSANYDIGSGTDIIAGNPGPGEGQDN